MSLRVTVIGTADAKARLRAVPAKVRRRSDEILPSATAGILAMAQRLAPRDSTALERSLDQQLLRGQDGSVVLIGPRRGARYFLRQRGRTRARPKEPERYAAVVERRRLYLLRSFNASMNQAKERYAGKLATAIASERF